MVTGIASAVSALLVHGFHMAHKTCMNAMNQDNKPIVSLAASLTSALSIVCAVALCAKCIRHTLHDPATEEVAFVDDDTQHCGTKIHIDSSASRHFVSDVRLFASLDEGAPYITFSTAAGVPITPRAGGTVTCLASDKQENKRVVELDRAYYVPNQPRNLISMSQFIRQQACKWKSPDFVDCTWVDNPCVTFEFSYGNREFSWKTEPIPGNRHRHGQRDCQCSRCHEKLDQNWLYGCDSTDWASPMWSTIAGRCATGYSYRHHAISSCKLSHEGRASC